MRSTTAWGHDTVQDRCSINAVPIRALHVSSSGRLQSCVLLQVLPRQLTLATTWLQLWLLMPGPRTLKPLQAVPLQHLLSLSQCHNAFQLGCGIQWQLGIIVKMMPPYYMLRQHGAMHPYDAVGNRHVSSATCMSRSRMQHDVVSPVYDALWLCVS